MKKLNISIAAIVFVCLCCASCSPKVMTTVLKTYPALPDTAYVALHEDSNNVSTSAELPQKISISRDIEQDNWLALRSTVAVNIGYGILLDGTLGLRSVERELTRRLSNGTDWGVRFILQSVRSVSSVGFIYDQYCSGFPGDKMIDEEMYSNHNFTVRSLMVDYVFREHVAPKWVFALYIGAGYIGAKNNIENISDATLRGSVLASALGCHFGLGLDYRFSRHFGIGADLSVLSGRIMKLRFDNFAPKDLEEIQQTNNPDYISRINVTVSLQYYL